MTSITPSTAVASVPPLSARRVIAASLAGLLMVLTGSGCVHELRGKSRSASHRHDETEEDEEDDDVVEPGNVRRRMHKVVKEPDPFNLNKILKDERTAEIERNLGIE